MLYMPENIGEHFNNLKAVIVVNCPVKAIYKNDFSGLESLDKIVFDRTDLKVLTSDLFYFTPHITFLQVSSSKLGNIESGTFDLCSDLIHLDLNKNNLYTLDRYLFQNTRRMKYLNLNDNPFIHIHHQTFDVMMKRDLDRIFLERCDCIINGYGVETFGLLRELLAERC